MDVLLGNDDGADKRIFIKRYTASTHRKNPTRMYDFFGRKDVSKLSTSLFLSSSNNACSGS
jgi:hypothetical protein